MTLLIILRLFILLKWLFQSIGIGFSISSLFPSQRTEDTLLISLLLFIIPELIIGGVFWIARGILSISKTKKPEDASNDILIFGESALNFSFYFYIAVLSSIALQVGSLLEMPLLFVGAMMLVGFAFRQKLKRLFDQCLDINN